MTARLAVWCVGGSGGTPAGLYGWAATDRLPYIGCGVSLGAGAVVSGLQAPDRGYHGAQAAVIPVSAAAASAGAVWTTLPPATTVVVVSLDAADEADLSTLALGLSGAVRTADANGSELPPTLVTAGGRGHLLFAVSPDPTAPPSSVVVSVATGSGWRLAGVLGGTSDVATIAARIAASGTADCVAPLIQEPTGSATVAWVPASPPPATSPNPVSAAAESPPRGTEASTS